MTRLLDHLDQARANGRKLFVPYLMGGLPNHEGFAAALAALDPIADTIEVGLPYSDPLMDGPVIAAAGERAIAAGIGPIEALEAARADASSTPRVVMTYYNPIHKLGEATFCERAAELGVAGLIVPDLPLEESEGLRRSASEHGLAWTPLIAPTSPPERVKAIAATSTGFIYAVSTLGVTGARAELSERAAKVAEACRAASDRPVCVGIGVSNAAHAIEAARVADGVVVGSALVAALLERGQDALIQLATEIRTALDGVA